jgi:Ser/Thr protein kinase RdoA (MazF antagonist)
MNDHFPVTYSTLSAQALATDLLPEYGLGAIANCKLHSTGVNDTYIVRTVGNVTYYLRVYRLGLRSRADVMYELDVLNHLHCKGVSVARPLPHQDGSFIRELLAPEGKRFTVLFTAALGQEPTDEIAGRMAFEYGLAVAELHNALQDFTSQHTRFHADLNHLIDIPLKHIRPLLSRRVGDWSYVQRFAGAVRQRILELPGSTLEQGVCHGDLQGFHHHIAPDGTMTFFDFDFCGFGYRAYDLSVFRWSGRLVDEELSWWEPYLRGYREIRPVSDLDLQAIPLFVCARHIWHMGLHTANAHDWGYGGLGDKYFDQRLQWLRALEADYLAEGT